MTAGGQSPRGEPEPGRGYRYNCPTCNNIALEPNVATCPHCETELVWSGRTEPPLDQPRRHPQHVGEHLDTATLYAIAGEPIKETVYRVPDLAELDEAARLAYSSPEALPPGEQAVPEGEAYALEPDPVVPGKLVPASAASGEQDVEVPAAALDKPDSLPGDSKPEVERPFNPDEPLPPFLPTPPEGKEKPVPKPVEPEVLEGLPEPPEGEEKKVPELLKAVDLSKAHSTLPDDPDPVAPLSHLRASEIAEVAHAANQAYRKIVGDLPGPDWSRTNEAEKESVIAGVRAVLCGTVVAAAISHKAWYDRKLSEGWVYGPEKDVAAKIHPNMLALGVWGDLPDHERRKDLLFLGIVVALIRDV